MVCEWQGQECGKAHLVAADVKVCAGEDGHNLRQDVLQELEGALLAGAVHVLVNTPVVRRLCHPTSACRAPTPALLSPVLRMFFGQSSVS